jgi:hypothetical protein
MNHYHVDRKDPNTEARSINILRNYVFTALPASVSPHRNIRGGGLLHTTILSGPVSSKRLLLACTGKVALK